jgi:exodeoxyribonuclease V alpha subunit
MKISATVSVSVVHPGIIGGAIFSGRDSCGESLRFVADRKNIFRAPIVGEVWAITGEKQFHPKYGDQVYVLEASLSQPTGRLIVNFLSKHPAFDGLGIGNAKAKRLWESFGTELPRILEDRDIEKLTFVLPEETARKLAEAWCNVSNEAEAISFLDHHGFDLRLATKALKVWPTNTLRKLNENPYRMLAFARWEKVDRMALSLGITLDDPRRQVAAVEASLYRRLDAKHTLTSKSIVLHEVAVLLGARQQQIAQTAVDRALQESAIVAHNDGYQPLGASVMERTITHRLREMLSGGFPKHRNLFSQNLPSVIADSVEHFESTCGFTLNSAQRRAVEMPFLSPLNVITGGAGTGKTTVLRVIHDVAEQVCIPVRQMALSGRAAQQMRDATKREASTIASFLRAAEGGEVDQDSALLVIIDECSMLDLPLMYSIIKALPANARLLLTGDPFQLPPIGFGQIFNVIATSANIPRVELIDIHRQTGSSGIPQIAHEVRHGVLPQLSSFDNQCTGVSFIEVPAANIVDRIFDVLAEWSKYQDTQVLGITKSGSAGVRNINAILHSASAASRNPLQWWSFAEGDPIIYLVNDYRRGLWNGSLGSIDKTLTEQDGRPAVSCTFDGVRHEIREEDFKNIELAYAITVHKAQGSQFKRVIVPVTPSRLLDRTLIYTALTRGIEQVVFIGDRVAFDQAILREPRSLQRQVGFAI